MWNSEGLIELGQYLPQQTPSSERPTHLLVKINSLGRRIYMFYAFKNKEESYIKFVSILDHFVNKDDTTIFWPHKTVVSLGQY